MMTVLTTGYLRHPLTHTQPHPTIPNDTQHERSICVVPRSKGLKALPHTQLKRMRMPMINDIGTIQFNLMWQQEWVQKHELVTDPNFEDFTFTKPLICSSAMTKAHSRVAPNAAVRDLE